MGAGQNAPQARAAVSANMLSILIQNKKQNQQFVHETGPLELGRGPQRDVRRLLVEDLTVSRDQLRIEEVADARVRVENLSRRKEIYLPAGPAIGVGGSRELELPVRLGVGETAIEISQAADGGLDRKTLMTISQPFPGVGPRSSPRGLRDLGEAPDLTTFAHWLETVIALQRSPSGSRDFYEQTAQALVDLVGLDVGMVLLRRGDGWSAVARRPADDRWGTAFSRTVLNYVTAEGRTLFLDPGSLPVGSHSIGKIQALVVSPVFGPREEVAGALYGVRHWRGRDREGIRPLEAQVVQLLAQAVGANLVRTEAMRTRVQFEQFFSAELARELERNPDLLEGRDQEVTILVSDLRGFTSLSERLGPQTTCGLVRDMMERLSEPILDSGGVIVDYAGDGILAMWNAPTPQPDHPVRACRTALAMFAEMPRLNEQWRPVVRGPLRLGIGINTGMAQVGNTGSRRKFKYGPHGLTVNVASRVQAATKEKGMAVLVTRATRDRLPGGFATRFVGRETLPGLAAPLELFEIQGESTTCDPDLP